MFLCKTQFGWNADRLWASTPQIADFHGFWGLGNTLYRNPTVSYATGPQANSLCYSINYAYFGRLNLKPKGFEKFHPQIMTAKELLAQIH